MRKDSHGSASHGRGTQEPSADLLARMGYESRDIAVSALARWLVVLVGFIGAAQLISYILFKAVVPDYAHMGPSGPMAHLQNVPPFPQIQSNPKRDMMDYRAAEDQVISGAASGTTKPSLSIDDAMNVIATQRGISGIKGDAVPVLDPNSKSYPGSGDYGGAITPSAPSVAPPGVDTDTESAPATVTPSEVTPSATTADASSPSVAVPGASPSASPSPAVPPAVQGNGATQ